MGKFGKWIGGGLGFTLGGPIGALAGFFLGSFFDDADSAQNTPYAANSQITQGDYMFSLLVLVAAVLKADGKILKSELDYVKKFLVQSFGNEGAKQSLIILKELTKQDIQVQEVCLQIRQFVDSSSRLQLVHFLFGIANADGQLHPDELRLIQQIATLLGLSAAEYSSLEAMFIPKTDWAYAILEITNEATNDEIKKAYRKMALKYHPDKVSYLGEDVQNAAKEKFQKLNEAYQLVCKERSIV
jgi:DnaJ like chaperone protein